MNFSFVGKFAKLLSGTLKLVASSRCGLLANQAVIEMDS